MSISSALQASVKAPAKELELSLEDISTTTRLLTRASRLRPRLNNMLRWEHLQQDERRLATDFMGYRDANGNLVTLSLLVVCYGLLENFIRELLERAVVAIDSELEKFDSLPENLTNENAFRTGLALQAIKAPRSHVSYDYAELGRNLGTCFRGSDSYTLNASCFSFAHGVMTPKNIDEMFRRIGVELDWNKFGGNNNLKKILKETKTTDCTKGIRKLLGYIVAKRNIIAHSGGMEIVLEENEFEIITAFIPAFCTVLVEQVAAQLQKKYG